MNSAEEWRNYKASRNCHGLWAMKTLSCAEGESGFVDRWIWESPIGRCGPYGSYDSVFRETSKPCEKFCFHHFSHWLLADNDSLRKHEKDQKSFFERHSIPDPDSRIDFSRALETPQKHPWSQVVIQP